MVPFGISGDLSSPVMTDHAEENVTDYGVLSK
jgi:hypothetical protein